MSVHLKGHLSLPWEGYQPDPFVLTNKICLNQGYQRAKVDEFLCMVAGCALGKDVCHCMFIKGQHGSRSTGLPFNTT